MSAESGTNAVHLSISFPSPADVCEGRPATYAKPINQVFEIIIDFLILFNQEYIDQMKKKT